MKWNSVFATTINVKFFNSQFSSFVYGFISAFPFDWHKTKENYILLFTNIYYLHNYLLSVFIPIFVCSKNDGKMFALCTAPYLPQSTTLECYVVCMYMCVMCVMCMVCVLEQPDAFEQNQAIEHFGFFFMKCLQKYRHPQTRTQV